MQLASEKMLKFTPAPRIDALLFPGDKQRGQEGDRNEITELHHLGTVTKL